MIINKLTVFLLSVCLFVFLEIGSIWAQVSSDSTYAITRVQDRYPSWSPDGKMITFESNREDGNYEIYIMTDTGKNITRLTNNKFSDGTPIWSPDGSLIMYSGYMDGDNIDNNIFLMRPDGSEKKQITEHPFRDGHSKFSPDGKKIIFNSQRDDEGILELKNYELYEMNIDGSKVKRLTDYFEWDTYPSYSPDGKRILWRRILADSTAPRGYNSEIFSMNSDGSDVKNLTKHKSYDGYPEWSPDGRHIVFASSRHGRNTGHIQLFTMNADGSNVRQLTWNKVGEEDNRPDWSIDGKRIVFNRVNKDGTRILIMNVSCIKTGLFFNKISPSAASIGGRASRGVAWGDYNTDGYPDLIVANTMNNSNYFFKNDTIGDFKQITGQPVATSAGWTQGANFIDYDNDGDLDIFFTTTSNKPNNLFRNDGTDGFVEIQNNLLTSMPTNSTSACWCDYDLDGDLDVYVVERDGTDDMLFNNLGEGTFDLLNKDEFPYLGGDGRACSWGIQTEIIIRSFMSGIF